MAGVAAPENDAKKGQNYNSAEGIPQSISQVRLVKGEHDEAISFTALQFSEQNCQQPSFAERVEKSNGFSSRSEEAIVRLWVGF